jgi:MerR family transcriptional regulator, copper efflux regulator
MRAARRDNDFHAGTRDRVTTMRDGPSLVGTPTSTEMAMAGRGMNIGEASAACGVSAKMIRYYESVSLIRPAGRTAAGYRRYDDADVRTLRFLKRARGLGFSVEQMRDLLALWRDEGRSKAEVRQLALSHAEALEAKAREINEITAALRDLARRCQSNDRDSCAIIDELAATSKKVLA